jgi:hypothetical protein
MNNVHKRGKEVRWNHFIGPHKQFTTTEERKQTNLMPHKSFLGSIWFHKSYVAPFLVTWQKKGHELFEKSKGHQLGRREPPKFLAHVVKA